MTKIDSKGRITIPLFIREMLGLEPEMYVAIEINKDDNTLIIKPISSSGELLADFEVVLNRPEQIQDLIKAVVDEGAEVRFLKCFNDQEGNSSCIITVAVVDMKAASLLRERMRKYGIKVVSMQPIQRKVIK